MKIDGPVMCVVGARPNLMKVAPILRAFAAHAPAIPARLAHTGQHYDHALDGQFFDVLGLPAPDAHLGVGSGTHAVQTAQAMERFEPVLDAAQAGAVLVVGDVNSSLACALVAAKKGVPVLHVEAGLRSGDWSMPEEINRVLIDRLSDLLFTTERSAADNLRREGIDPARVHFVGNVMIDSLRQHLPGAGAGRQVIARLDASGLLPREGAYGVVTLHRPSNVDDAGTLKHLFAALAEAAVRLPLVFPVHPRTRARLEAAGLSPGAAGARILLVPPLGYVDMLALMHDAALVLTDSGGMQEEATALGVPCGTLRENTERPVTVSEGTNELVGRDRPRIVDLVARTLAGGGKRGRVPELWDGRAAGRIAGIVASLR